MRKEPIGLYIVRFLAGFGLCVFMGMLYWSSLLVEEDLQEVRSELAGIKSEIRALRTGTDRIRDEVVRALQRSPPPSASSAAEAVSPHAVAAAERKHIDPALPNLLESDPFYEETLPKLLGEGFEPRGVRHEANVGKPNDLHPFTNWSQVSNWRGMCSVTLAQMKFGIYETMAPNMALKIEQRMRKDKEVPEYWVHLRDDVYWQPLSQALFPPDFKLADQFKMKHQVTAEDYKFFFDAMMNPYNQEPGAVSLRTYYGDMEGIEIVDPFTFIVRWQPKEFRDDQGNVVWKIKYIARQLTGGLTPLPSFVYKYFADGSKIVADDDPETYRTNSVWAQNFKEHWAKNVIVSCGGWIFEGMSDRQISFKRNPEHYQPLEVLFQRMEEEFKNSPDSIWQDFKQGRLETYSLRPDQLIEYQDFLDSEVYSQQAKNGAAVKRLDYPSRTYLYIGWNMDRPYFKDKRVRQAMTMAIDRDRIINQYLNGMGIRLDGPFSPFSPANDKAVVPWPFDPMLAKALLEEAGWYDSDGDGILDKEINGKRVSFVFSLTYYVKNPTTKAICEYVATALKEIGVKCQLNGVDIADLSAVFDDKGFDALCLGWALGTPPEDPRQLWHSSGAKEPGSSNAVGFANKEADEIIEKLTFEADDAKRIALYHRFHRIIHEEQPYTFLYAPKAALLYREYVQNVFIPAERQDLIPGANVPEPNGAIFWVKER